MCVYCWCYCLFSVVIISCCLLISIHVGLFLYLVSIAGSPPPCILLVVYLFCCIINALLLCCVLVLYLCVMFQCFAGSPPPSPGSASRAPGARTGPRPRDFMIGTNTGLSNKHSSYLWSMSATSLTSSVCLDFLTFCRCNIGQL